MNIPIAGDVLGPGRIQAGSAVENQVVMGLMPGSWGGPKA